LEWFVAVEMPVEKALRSRITSEFKPEYLLVLNESHMHSVPENSETHFKVVAVSENFEGMRAVKRHQSIYGLLPDLMQNPIHALSMHLFTPGEWAENSDVRESPDCLGGSKK
jgi:stress-induced morphogen